MRKDALQGAVCGMPEHTHTEACWEESEESAEVVTLTCGLEEHQHSDACLTAQPTEEELAQANKAQRAT